MLDLESLKKQFFSEIASITSSSELEGIKIKYLGKKGLVQSLMPLLKSAKESERPELGKKINDLKELLISECDKLASTIEAKEKEKRFSLEEIDVTLPGRDLPCGNLHPITHMIDRALNIFSNMGFSIQDGPNIESDFYNFEALNFPKGHPAREMQDSFYLTAELLLRTHTSNVQVRIMECHKPPIRVVSPGRCFRNENISSRSHVFFHQIEIFYIDEQVSFADLFNCMEEFWSRLFDRKIEIRCRPSFFPFVEPGMEVDINCLICGGEGCKVCKQTGWLEVGGAGMIHPEVLKFGGIDPRKSSGYAAALGIERLVMLMYGMKDIRAFTENDLRFLNQFI